MRERDVIEEAEGVGGLAARTPGELPLLDEVRQIRLHLVVGQLIR